MMAAHVLRGTVRPIADDDVAPPGLALVPELVETATCPTWVEDTWETLTCTPAAVEMAEERIVVLLAAAVRVLCTEVT